MGVGVIIASEVDMSLRRISDIDQMPVLDLETGEILGQIVGWVVQPAQQKIVAYILTQPTLWRKAQIIVPADIVEYGPRMVVVRDKTVVISPDEVVGLLELLRDEVSLIKFRAETESGKGLGIVNDFIIEVTGSTIQQYYIEPPLLAGGLTSDWIVSASQVVRIEQRKIIFPDNILSGAKLAAQQPQTI